MTGLPVVTEVVNPRDVELVSRYVDMLQVGARNMQNFALPREVGRAKKPVLLKRGLAATIAEWLTAAEYIVSAGNYDVILCERGIRTYETSTRNTLDLSAVAEVQRIFPPARAGRSEPFHGQVAPGRPDEQSGDCRRGRRVDHRGPSQSRASPIRWAPIP